MTLPLSYSRLRGPVVVSTHRRGRRPRAGRAKLVARGGFEPPKPLGRQIYSLLRLTAPQPRRIPRPSAPGARGEVPAAFERRCNAGLHLGLRDSRDARSRTARQADSDTVVTSTTGDHTDHRDPPVTWKQSAGAGEGIRTPDPLITNQLLYRTELRQPDQTENLARPAPSAQDASPRGPAPTGGPRGPVVPRNRVSTRGPGPPPAQAAGLTPTPDPAQRRVTAPRRGGRRGAAAPPRRARCRPQPRR